MTPPIKDLLEAIRPVFQPYTRREPAVHSTPHEGAWLCLQLRRSAFVETFADYNDDSRHLHFGLYCGDETTDHCQGIKYVSYLRSDLQDVLHQAMLRYRLEGGSQ